ncbi:CoA transferase [Rhodococcus sp. WS4]|nr:CoA transferase [Rhodococcus sp. WS4]
MTTTPRPLEGIRVVSLAEQYPGPFATLLLGDLGADVVQVERPGGGDPSRAFPGFYEALNRGKRSVTLDLKAPEGLDACRRLIEGADVLLEGFRPGVMARLDLGPDEILATHPDLVYVSVSGFGQDGPLRDHPAHDLSFQALAGLLDPQTPAGPQLPLLSLADLSAGVFAALAALTGLVGGSRHGRGGHYDVAMFDSLLTFVAARLVPLVNGNSKHTLGLDPGYGLFATADGRWISLSIAFEDHFWRALCEVLDLPAFGELNGEQRVEQRRHLRAAVAERIVGHPADHWEKVLSSSGVPYGAVNQLDDLLDLPQVRARDILQTLDTADGERIFARQPMVVDGASLGPRRGAPRLGEHTAEVLLEIGMDPVVVNRLLDADATDVPKTQS